MSEHTTLSMLVIHLKNTPDIAREWYIGQLAYHSLRKEGVERISQIALRARMDLVRWLISVVGHPLMSFEVVPFSSLPRTNRPPRASNLVTMRLADGRRELGAIVEGPPPEGATSILSRPKDGSWLGLPLRPTLASDNPQDIDLFQHLYDQANIVSHMVLAAKPEVSPERVVLSKDAKKIDSRLRSQVTNAQVVLQSFEVEEWKELKDSAFSQTLQKLRSLKKAAAEEQVVSLIEKAESWANGLQLVKSFMKRWRDTSKAKGHRKFADLDDLASRLYEFLRKHVVVGVSFLLCRIRARFQSHDKDGISDRFAAILEIGAFNVMSAIPANASEGTSPDPWLRGLLVGEVVHTIELADIEQVEELRLKLHGELKKIVALLHGYPKKAMISGLLVDLEMLLVLLSAGLSGSAHPLSQVVAAKKHFMECARLALLKKTLWEDATGIELMSPVDGLEQKGIHDDLADQRFNTGQACFADSAFFRLDLCAPDAAEVSDGERDALRLIVQNSSMIMPGSMTITAVVLDSLSQVAEGIKLWSSRRRQERMVELRNVFRCVRTTIVAIDLCSVYGLLVVCTGAMDDFMELGLEDRPAHLQGKLESFAKAFRTVGEVRTNAMITALGNLTRHFVGAFPEAESEIAACVRKTTRNTDLRHAIFKTLGCISSLSTFGLPSSASGVIEQWSLRGEGSFLAAALALMDDIAVLKSLRNFDFNKVCMADALAGDEASSWEQHGVDKVTVVNHDCGTPGVPLCDILGIAKKILCSPAVSFVQRLLASCVEAMPGNFYTLAKMDALIQFDELDPAMFQCMSLKDIAEEFARPMGMASSLPAIGLHVRDPDPLPLPLDDAHHALAQLVRATGTVSWNLHPPAVANTVALPAESALRLFDLYGVMHKIGATLVWLATTAASGPILIDSKLKAEVEASVDLILSSVTEATEVLERHDDDGGSALPDGLAFPLKRCKVWVAAATAATAHVQRRILEVALAHISELCKITKGDIPGYDHFLSDDVFNSKLVKNRLVAWKNQERLTSSSVKLWRATSEGSRLQKKFHLPVVDEDQVDEVAEGLAQACNVFKDAKKAITIVVAARAIFKLTGLEQAMEIKRLLDTKKELLPRSLLTELEKARLQGGAENPGDIQSPPPAKRAKVEAKSVT